jgi:hypothetical protein
LLAEPGEACRPSAVLLAFPVGMGSTIFVSIVAFLLLGVTGCGIWTVRAQDVVQSNAFESLGCADVAVAAAADGSYVATGCGRMQRYVCERDVATAYSKPGAIAAVGCRRDARSHIGDASPDTAAR